MQSHIKITRGVAAFALCLLATSRPLLLSAQQATASLPESPSSLFLAAASRDVSGLAASATSEPTLNLDPAAALADSSSLYAQQAGTPPDAQQAGSQQAPTQVQPSDQKHKRPRISDADLERYQPPRILGFIPNFRTVSAEAKPHALGWKYNFTVATHQSTDYSSFIFLGLTSLTAEWTDTHPDLGKGIPGFYSYTWRGFLDKTDNTYLSAWLLPSLLHEDTRYYALGHGHRIITRSLYVISQQAVARTYSGHTTVNVAGLGGKVLTQYISRFYYPASAGDLESLSAKFGYSVMRDVGFSAIREFYPDVAAHYIRRHREKVAAQAALDLKGTQSGAH